MESEYTLGPSTAPYSKTLFEPEPDMSSRVRPAVEFNGQLYTDAAALAAAQIEYDRVQSERELYLLLSRLDETRNSSLDLRVLLLTTILPRLHRAMLLYQQIHGAEKPHPSTTYANNDFAHATAIIQQAEELLRQKRDDKQREGQK